MRELLHIRNYLSDSKLGMISWDTIELDLTKKSVIFSLWETEFFIGFCHIKIPSPVNPKRIPHLPLPQTRRGDR